MTLFTAADYETLAAIVFRDDYPGNATARGVVEIPNGTGAADTDKRYAHVATKYILWSDAEGTRDMTQDEYRLYRYLQQAHHYAVLVAQRLAVPFEFAPSFKQGALRVLEYPSGATSAEHTDFDLFTINCYRNVTNPGLPDLEVHIGELGELLGLGPATPHHVAPLDVVQHSVVYFAIPSLTAVLPSGQSVGAWLGEHTGRSRTQRGAAPPGGYR